MNNMTYKDYLQMVDMFSKEFLSQLRTDSYSKAKTSKALLNAIQDLSAINQGYKRKVQEQEQYITDLKQENSLLIQLLEAAKADYNDSLALKDKKMKVLIDQEAKLISENESNMRQIQNYETQLEMLKQMAIRLKSNTELGSKEQLRLSEIIMSRRSMKDSKSSFDLEAYISNEKKNLKTSRSKTIKSIDQNIQVLQTEGQNPSFFQGFQESEKPIIGLCEGEGNEKKGIEYSSLDSGIFNNLLS